MKILTPTASYFIPARTFVVAGLWIAFMFSCLLVRIASLERLASLRQVAKQQKQIASMRESAVRARKGFDRMHKEVS